MTLKENSLVLPHVHGAEWAEVFSNLSQHLFSSPEEYTGFEYSIPTSFDDAFKFFSSYSSIAGGSERIKKDFPIVFNDATKKHFKDKGIPFDNIQLKMYMYWCVKEN